MTSRIAIWAAVAAFSLTGCQSEATSQAGSTSAVPAKAAAALCPSNPKIGRRGTVSGQIEVLERGGTMTFISVAGCPVRIFAEGQAAASCRRGGWATARGRIEEYDLFPTMETFFIGVTSVQCS